LDQGEIDRMVDDAKEHEAEDKSRREMVEVRNQLDTLVYQTEKSLADYKDKLDASDLESLETAIKEAKEALNSEDSEKMSQAMEALTKASHKLAELMYQEVNADETAGNPASDGATDNGDADTDDAAVDADNVVDAEVVED
jgi:molecular chaperone DnaK